MNEIERYKSQDRQTASGNFYTHTHTRMIGGIFRNKDQERLDIVPQAAQCVKNYGVIA